MEQFLNKIKTSFTHTSTRVWVGLALAVTVLLVILFALNNRANDHGTMADHLYAINPEEFLLGYMQSNDLHMEPISAAEQSEPYELTNTPIATFIEIARTLHHIETGEASQIWKLTDVTADGVYQDENLLLTDVAIVFEKNGKLDDRSGHYVSTIRFDLQYGMLQWTNEWFARRSSVHDLMANGEVSPDVIIGIAESNGGEDFCAQTSGVCSFHMEKRNVRWITTFRADGRDLTLSIHQRSGKVRGN